MSVASRIVLGLAALSAAAPPVQAAPAKKDDPGKVICRTLPELGSRLAEKRVCLTREQWRQQKEMEQQTLDKMRIRTGPGAG
jgi:Spy/CpxP family protein refolding chaperone